MTKGQVKQLGEVGEALNDFGTHIQRCENTDKTTSFRMACENTDTTTSFGMACIGALVARHTPTLSQRPAPATGFMEKEDY